MGVYELKKIFAKKKQIKFALYNLEYIIKQIDDIVIVYPCLYETRKCMYNSLEEALHNYTVYNESIIENMDRLILL